MGFVRTAVVIPRPQIKAKEKQRGQVHLLTSRSPRDKLALMPRAARQVPGGLVYHVLNRGVGRMRLFRTDQDYDAFEEILAETLEIQPMRVVAYCAADSRTSCSGADRVAALAYDRCISDVAAKDHVDVRRRQSVLRQDQGVTRMLPDFGTS